MSACQQTDTRLHRKKPPLTGIAGQSMPGGITANWPTGSAGSLPDAGFRIRKRTCSNSRGAMIASAAGAPTDDRRTARMDAVDHVRVDGIHHADSAAKSANASAIASQPPAAAHTPWAALTARAETRGGSSRECPSTFEYAPTAGSDRRRCKLSRAISPPS
jgi:hypothetical protein